MVDNADQALCLVPAFKDHQKRHLDLLVVMKFSVYNSVGIANHLIIAIGNANHLTAWLEVANRRGAKNMWMPPALSFAVMLIPNLFHCLFVTVRTEGNVTILTKKLQKIHVYQPSSIWYKWENKHSSPLQWTSKVAINQQIRPCSDRATDSVSGADHSFTSGICGRRVNQSRQFNE